MATIDKLVDICRVLGGRVPHWVQGKGGNVSVKDGRLLWIKASGAHLSTVTPSHGIARVNLDRFADAHTSRPAGDAESWYADTLMACAEGPARPSMETGFHAVMPGPWILHVHSLAAIAMGHHRRLDRTGLDALVDSHAPFAVQFVDAELPGWNLSRRLEGQASPAIVLANHGVILQGDDPADLIDRWTAFEQTFATAAGCPALVGIGRQLGDDDLQGQPFRAYFPDAVVFRDAVIAASADPVAARRGGADQRDAVEILEAIALLDRACPGLAELPAPQQLALATLPTETFRKA